MDKFTNVCTPGLPSLTWTHVYSVVSYVSSFPENHGKIPRRQLVSMKTHNSIQRLENWLKWILRLFLKASSPEKFRGQLNKKFAQLDEIRIGSGRDWWLVYKAWLICAFARFSQKHVYGTETNSNYIESQT